eukprot:908455-Pyramimonas_sp.AAC.1
MLSAWFGYLIDARRASLLASATGARPCRVACCGRSASVHGTILRWQRLKCRARRLPGWLPGGPRRLAAE